MLLLHKEEARRAATRANTFQIRRREVGGANGRPQGPQPRIPASPAPTIDGLGGPLRRIVGEPCLGDRYSGVRMWGVGPCGQYISNNETNPPAPSYRRGERGED